MKGDNVVTNDSGVQLILLAEDDEDLRQAMSYTLENAGYRVIACADGLQAMEALERLGDVALVLTDVNMPNMDGMGLLRAVRRHANHIPVVMLTAFGTIADAVAAMRDGAADYIVKPCMTQDLIRRVSALITTGQTFAIPGGAVVHDNASRHLFALAARVARSDATVLVEGESGTGKEVLARFIHAASRRASGPFVAINCAAIPDTMLESMLFGYEKGAYTGAVGSMPGKFELANGGTLLLDEISEMPSNLQVKLLRVLQEREVERLGARGSIALDVRVIATSNRNMDDEVRAGRFREDLFYRINVFPLHTLPLRERKEDIVELANSFIAKHGDKPYPILTEAARQWLLDQPWAGNARELENTVQRALILHVGNAIDRTDFLIDEFDPERVLMDSWPSSVCCEGRGVEPVPDVLVTRLSSEPVLERDAPGAVMKLTDYRSEHELSLIMKTLSLNNGSRKKTAEQLGISERTLRYKLAKLNHCEG